MKKYFLFLIFITYSTMMLNAKETTIINVEAFCSDTSNLFTNILYTDDAQREMFTIKINSKQLNLSEDAVQENPSGYVSIAEDRHFFKLNDDIYNLKGAVEHSKKDRINQFTSHIYNKPNSLINTKELYSLRNNKNLKYIQKITLKYGSIKTNLIDVTFDENLVNREYQRCKEQINKSKNTMYLQSSLLILFIFGILYMTRKKLVKS
ncbi:hypothetical protein [Sulfurimonas sp.]